MTETELSELLHERHMVETLEAIQFFTALISPSVEVNTTSDGMSLWDDISKSLKLVSNEAKIIAFQMWEDKNPGFRRAMEIGFTPHHIEKYGSIDPFLASLKSLDPGQISADKKESLTGGVTQ